MGLVFICACVLIAVAFGLWMAWTAWQERGERNRTSHEGSRTSVGRRW